ncbi:winged helix-turn-helix domain-containing protein [Natrinema salifodinae]|uniref:winged helix-turn-helix domain-containing protein n=1 Tax=Natrinema salifodinae TaxID=1202768 RepID=UPI001364D36C|nr:helix-turn-helix domain-containing protein [Natrinema salifodinae]
MIDAFKVLSDETRLAILLALWDGYEPFAGDDALSFSELLDRVDYDTSGNFSYHLQKLEDHFVESTPEGYRLKQAGHKIVRAVIAGRGLTDATLEPTEIDADCTICGEPLAIAYEDEHLYTICSGCGGKFGADSEKLPGTVMGFAFDPAGLARPTAEEIFAASVFRAMQKFTMQMGGLCPDCSGPVDSSMNICEEHSPNGICSNCGRRDQVQARWVCTVCKNSGHGPPGGNLVLHPRVVAFYADRGLDIGYDATDFETIVEVLEAMSNHDQEVVSAEPPRVRVTVRYRGDELRLLIDESMNVITVED